jgi:hypothetical protein
MGRIVTSHTSLFLFLILLASSILSLYYNCQKSMAQTINTTPSENIASRKTTEFLTYKNSIYGFTIQYPANWEKIDFSKGIEEDDRHIVVTFLSPSEGTLDIFREYLIIQVGDKLMFNRSLEQYVDTQVNSLRRSLSNFQIVESNTTTVAGNLAHTIVYIFKVGEDEYKVTENWTIKDDKLYYLKYSTESENNSGNHGSTIRKMIDSFRITG